MINLKNFPRNARTKVLSCSNKHSRSRREFFIGLLCFCMSCKQRHWLPLLSLLSVLSFQGWLYSKQPWKVRHFFPSGIMTGFLIAVKDRNSTFLWSNRQSWLLPIIKDIASLSLINLSCNPTNCYRYHHSVGIGFWVNSTRKCWLLLLLWVIKYPSSQI